MNLEVQWANEQSIAAVERNGGVLTTAYYDILSVTALCNPEKWFEGDGVVTEFKFSKSNAAEDCVAGSFNFVPTPLVHEPF